MPAQVMKASHNGWVDFTKGLVKLPPTSQTAHAAERTSSEGRREGSKMDGLRLAIVGLPMSVLSMASIPALAQTNPNLMELPTTSDTPRLVDLMDDSSKPTVQTAEQTADVKMLNVARSSTVFAPAPDSVHARDALTLAPSGDSSTNTDASNVSASSFEPFRLPSSQLSLAAISGASGLVLARRRSPIK